MKIYISYFIDLTRKIDFPMDFEMFYKSIADRLMDGRTDRLTDRPHDGRTNPLIEMR